MDSILNTIKQSLGIPQEQPHFDVEIIMYINSAFSDLWELGVGPSEPYTIVDENNRWDEFLEESEEFENVKTYVYVSVKLLFDPPLSSSVLSALERKLKELEWRLTTKAETK